MNLKGWAAAGTVAATLVGLGGATAFAAGNDGSPSSSAPSSSSSTACAGDRDDHWPAVAQGRPEGFDAGDLGGAYVWHDGDGWHVRVTHANDDKAVLSGVITTSGRIVDVHGVRLEKGDVVRVGPNQHELRFRFTNYGHIDGIDFRTQCAPALRLGFARGGKSLPADRVFLGAEKGHPASDPFRLRRTDV